MCVGVPCKVLSIDSGVMPMGRIEVAGKVQDVCMAYLPEARVGDYVLIQSGFAMTLLTAEEAADSLDTWRELGVTS